MRYKASLPLIFVTLLSACTSSTPQLEQSAPIPLELMIPCPLPREARSVEDVGQAYKDNMASYGACIRLHIGLLDAIGARQ